MNEVYENPAPLTSDMLQSFYDHARGRIDAAFYDRGRIKVLDADDPQEGTILFIIKMLLKAARSGGPHSKCGTCDHEFTKATLPTAFVALISGWGGDGERAVMCMGICPECEALGEDAIIARLLTLSGDMFPDIREVNPASVSSEEGNTLKAITNR